MTDTPRPCKIGIIEILALGLRLGPMVAANAKILQTMVHLKAAAAQLRQQPRADWLASPGAACTKYPGGERFDTSWLPLFFHLPQPCAVTGPQQVRPLLLVICGRHSRPLLRLCSSASCAIESAISKGIDFFVSQHDCLDAFARIRFIGVPGVAENHHSLS